MNANVLSLMSQDNRHVVPGHEEFSYLFVDDDWREKLVYLADIFQHFNVLHSGFQEPVDNVLKFSDELSAFQVKISMWLTNLGKGNKATFHLFLEEKKMT